MHGASWRISRGVQTKDKERAQRTVFVELPRENKRLFSVICICRTTISYYTVSLCYLFTVFL
jgi:hypothetical protein